MSETWVHVRFPVETAPDDTEWLVARAATHAGEIGKGVYLTDPLQQYASFADVVAADAFVADLTSAGRWTAHCSGGCGICGGTYWRADELPPVGPDDSR
jgi:hypothetical protein